MSDGLTYRMTRDRDLDGFKRSVSAFVLHPDHLTVVRGIAFLARTVFKTADRRKSRDASSACDPVVEPGVDVEAILAEATETKGKLDLYLLSTNTSHELVSTLWGNLDKAAPLPVGI